MTDLTHEFAMIDFILSAKHAGELQVDQMIKFCAWQIINKIVYCNCPNAYSDYAPLGAPAARKGGFLFYQSAFFHYALYIFFVAPPIFFRLFNHVSHCGNMPCCFPCFFVVRFYYQ